MTPSSTSYPAAGHTTDLGLLCNSVSSAIREGIYAKSVAEIIRSDLKSREQMPSRALIAKRLDLRSHTSCRRLEQEGKTLSDIRRLTRRDLALQFLSKTNDTVEHIAFRLGYSEASAFIRAFQDCTTMTPLAYRKTARSSSSKA